MMDTYVRPAYQKIFLDPIAALLARFEVVKPNHVTIVAIVLGLIAAIFIFFHAPLLATMMLLLSGYCDGLDGTLARRLQLSSNEGAVLDIVGDRLVEFAVMFAFYCIAPQGKGYVALLMLGASYLCVTTFLVVGVFRDNYSEKSFHYSVGLMERTEAFLFFIVMLWLPGWFTFLGWAYAILVFYTAVRRVMDFWKRKSDVKTL